MISLPSASTYSKVPLSKAPQAIVPQALQRVVAHIRVLTCHSCVGALTARIISPWGLKRNSGIIYNAY